ncbi:alanine racemase [bacterium]|nr:alanine racemase [bacterium]
MNHPHGTFSEHDYTPKLAGLDDLGSSLITLTVDLNQYRENLRAIRDFIAPAKLICVVKANAYGFGAAGLVPILNEFNADISCGVATADEALELKAVGYQGRIILLGYTHPKNYYQIIQSGCQLSAYRPENIPALAQACRHLDRPLELHIKIDTGMTRLGISLDELPGFIRQLRDYPQFRVVGLFSHLVDSGTPDAQVNAQQEGQFLRAVKYAAEELGYTPECHLANSGGVLNLPHLHLDSVRVGILAYGITPPGEFTALPPVQPCFQLASEVIDIHRVLPGRGVSYSHSWRAEQETTICTLPCGYADGLPRALSNRASVLIGGRGHPLVGNVTMDYIMADVGDQAVSIGDEAVLIGRQGAAVITLDEVAKLAGLLPYEIPCALGRRVRRVYVGK